MILIIPASKLQSIVCPDVPKYSEQLFVCLTDDEGVMVIMGLTQYCLCIRGRKLAHRRTIGSARHALTPTAPNIGNIISVASHHARRVGRNKQHSCPDGRPYVRTSSAQGAF